MDVFIDQLKKILERKKSLNFATRQALVAQQLKYINDVIKHEGIEKHAVEKLIYQIQDLETYKEFNISEKDFLKILSEKDVEKKFAHSFFDFIRDFEQKIDNLKGLLIRQSTVDSIELLNREAALYGEIEVVFKNINFSEQKIQEYFEDMKSLTYKKKWVKGGQIVAKLINKVLYGVKVEGLENIPKKGPCILAPHHFHANVDPILLSAVVSRPLYYLTAVETYFPVTEKLWANIGCIPFLRDDSKFNSRRDKSFIMKKEDVDKRAEKMNVSHVRSILQMLKHLKHNEVIVFYPAGDAKFLGTYQRPHNEDFLPVQEGIVYLPYLAKGKYGIDVPIIPVGIKYDSLHFGFFSRSITLKVGEPIHVASSLQGLSKKNLRKKIDEYTQKIDEIIQELSK